MKRALLIAAPLHIEAVALRSGARSASVVVCGMGPKRARRAAAGLSNREARAFAVMGFCGATASGIEPGDVVVASELRGPDSVVQCVGSTEIAGLLTGAGMRAHSGPIACVEQVARGPARALLGEQGSLAVDMESLWLAQGAADRPLAVVRAVVDTPQRELTRPLMTLTGAGRAMRSLRRAARVIESWARTA